MPQYERESIRELKKENRELQQGLQAVTARLQAETVRAELALKSAADAWAFARVALKTGRPRAPGPSVSGTGFVGRRGTD